VSCVGRAEQGGRSAGSHLRAEGGYLERDPFYLITAAVGGTHPWTGGDRIDAADEHDRDRRRCRLGRKCRREECRCNDRDLAIDELGGELRQSLIAGVCTENQILQ